MSCLFFHDPATPETYTLSLHDALPIFQAKVKVRVKEVAIAEDSSRSEAYRLVDTTVGRALLFDIVPDGLPFEIVNKPMVRSEEHTSELQSRPHLVCRLLLEKQKTYDDI